MGAFAARIVKTVARPVRALARSQNPAVRLAKRASTSMLHRLDVVAPASLKSGDVLYVDLANAVGRGIWLRGDYSSEEPITSLIKSVLGSGDIFLDVGANVGFFSLTASRLVGADGQVHSFEPLPKLADLLRQTVAANGLANLSVVEAAVGAASGIAAIAAMPDSAYSHLIDGAARIDGSHGGWKSIPVRTISLDEYVAENIGRPPRLIKMDIEGSEIEAIDGARGILSGLDGPDVICEVGETHLARFKHTPTELFARFEEMGYTALRPDTRQVMRVGDLSPHDYNVFFSKTSRQSNMREAWR